MGFVCVVCWGFSYERKETDGNCEIQTSFYPAAIILWKDWGRKKKKNKKQQNFSPTNHQIGWDENRSALFVSFQRDEIIDKSLKVMTTMICRKKLFREWLILIILMSPYAFLMSSKERKEGKRKESNKERGRPFQYGQRRPGEGNKTAHTVSHLLIV